MMPIDQNRHMMRSPPPLLAVHIQHKAEGGEVDDEYEMMAGEILEAIEAKDSKALADSLYAFFQKCDMEPHEEGPHED